MPSKNTLKIGKPLGASPSQGGQQAGPPGGSNRQALLPIPASAQKARNQSGEKGKQACRHCFCVVC
eukprot:856939-Rhodomonas_salina.1